MYIAETIKTSVEEAKSVLAAGLKLVSVLAPILIGAILGLPLLTPQEILAVTLTVVGLTFGMYWLK